MEKVKKRAGFTLIEVMVALGIFLILILALVGSYYSYYNSVKQMAYRAIGQNIAELQLEDIRYLPTGILDLLCKGGQYPTEDIWQYYKLSADSKYYDLATEAEEKLANIPNAIPFPPDKDHNTVTYTDSKTGEIVTVENVYNSFKTDDSAFRLERINSILGVTNLVDFDPDGSLQQYLPDNIIITPVAEYDNEIFMGYDYTIILNKEVFPYYQKKIEITDETPSLLTKNKIFRINVTVYWTVGGHIDPSLPGQIIGGTTKHITVTTEKSAGQ
jgi:prepilin-type N-terminal cleavage/methylation domain-containing protein